MAGFTIAGGKAEHLKLIQEGVNKELTAEKSRDLLKNYRAHLISEDGVKAGVIHIRNEGGADKLVRDRAYHLRSRGGEGFKNTADFLKATFASAYENKVGPQKYKALTEALEKYLGNRDKQLGTKTFANLVDLFEKAVLQHEAAVGASGVAVSADTAALLSGKREDQVLSNFKVIAPRNRNAEQPAEPEVSFQDVKKNVEDGLAKNFGKTVKSMGEGSNMRAYKLGESDSEGFVVTMPKNRQFSIDLSLEQLEVGDVVVADAARRSPMPQVIIPTSYIVSVSRFSSLQVSHQTGQKKSVSIQGNNSELFEVPIEHVRDFIKAQGDDATFKLVGVRMPVGAGTNLQEAVEGKPKDPVNFPPRPLESDEFSKVASHIVQGLDEMHRAGVLHHDIKPANLVYDRESGQVKIIDLGCAVPLNQEGKTNQLKGYSPGFMPKPVQRQPLSAHGPEVDRYAMAVTLLNAMAPSMPVMRVLKEFDEASEKIWNGLDPEQDPVELYVNALRDAANPNLEGMREAEAEVRRETAKDAAEALKELESSFNRIENSRSILQTAFRAGAPGPAGKEAWETLQRMLQPPVENSEPQPILNAGSPQSKPLSVIDRLNDPDQLPDDAYDLPSSSRRGSFGE
jgi:Protein kinase domain